MAAKRFNGETKTTENLEFTLHYADGTKERVKEGVLFTLNDKDQMDIHVGVKEAWKLFGVYLCLMEFLDATGLGELFDGYINEMLKEKPSEE